MHGVKFGNIHSFTDLNLILSEVTIPPAEPKSIYIDIPGGDGSVDLTEALGEVKYNDRECTFVFSVLPSDNYEEKKREISNLLNGKRFEITLDKDSEWYYDGRVSIDYYTSDKRKKQITVKAVAKPYKLKNEETILIALLTDSPYDLVLTNARKTVVPTLTVSEHATIVYNGNTFEFGAGQHVALDLTLTAGRHVFTVSGSGALNIVYTEGAL